MKIFLALLLLFYGMPTYITAQSIIEVYPGDNLNCTVLGAKLDNGVYMACPTNTDTNYLSGWSVERLYPGDGVHCVVRNTGQYNLAFMDCFITNRGADITPERSALNIFFLPLVER